MGMQMLGIVLVVSMMPQIFAHNWFNYPQSRTRTLSKATPCPSKPAPTFVSVVANQGKTFPIEWSSGHKGGDIYFTIVKAEDEKKLTTISENMLNDYIKKNKGKNMIKSDSHKYRKVQSRWRPHKDDKKGNEERGKKKRDGDPFSITSEEKKDCDNKCEIKKGDKDFISRSHDPKKWRCDYLDSCKMEYETAQFRYKKKDYDFLGFVKDSKYEHIVGVGRYKLEGLGRGKDHDLAEIAFPDTVAPGDYIIQFRYRGYRDCLDVKLFKKGQNLPALTSEKSMSKIDHCEFPEGRRYSKGLPDAKSNICKLIIPGKNGYSKAKVADCVEACKKNDECDGVNVVPLQKPNGLRFSWSPNVPEQCQGKVLDDFKREAGSDVKKAFICYPLSTKKAKPPLYLNHRVADQDAEDAMFYSTCYLKQYVQRVEGSSTESVSKRNIFGTKCISCTLAEKNAGLSKYSIAHWELTSECKLCDVKW